MVEENTVRICGDPFPHLKHDGIDFTTCMLPCVQPEGHRPETPHKCVDGCEWMVDTQAFIDALRSVRVLLRNDKEHTFPNAEYHVDVRTKRLTVYRLVGLEREVLARFALDVVSHYEYSIEE